MNHTTASTYFHLTLKNVPNEHEDLISSFCFDSGAMGVSEKLDFRQTSEKYEPETLQKSVIELDVFFEARPDQQFFEQLKAQYPMLECVEAEEENKDWNEEWKKGFEEFELVDGYWVVPSWRTPPAVAKKFLKIDPGMAFGTGTHETTQLASQALLELSQSSLSNLKSVLDVGTGTGILAMLATQLGAEKVIATEIDDMAREAGVKNVADNGMSQQVHILQEQVEAVTDTFPLVMANIIDGVLLDLQSELKRCLAPEGLLLLTGILQERESGFCARFQLPTGYQWKRRWQKGEWVALLGAPE